MDLRTETGMSWEEIAMRQAAEIADLSSFCQKLIIALAQFTEVEEEEKKMKEITEEQT